MTKPSDPAAKSAETGQPEADRRAASDRRAAERRKKDTPVADDRRAGERRKVQRRKRRGPNSYDLSADEMEFIQAINGFKERTGRAFPTWSEVLGILRQLGYEKG